MPEHEIKRNKTARQSFVWQLHAQMFMLQALFSLDIDMVCSGCGHEMIDHKSITQSMHYCNKCQQLESYVSFSDKEKSEAPPSGPGEMLSRYFKTASQ